MSDQLLEFVVRAYDAEIERKDSVLQQAALAAAVLSVNANIAVYLFLDYQVAELEWWHLCFYVPFVSGTIPGLYSLAALGAIFRKGVIYRYMPDALKVVEHAKTLETFYAGKPAEATVEFQRGLVETYAKCAAFNRTVNIARMERIAAAIKSAILCLLLLLVSLPAYYLFRLNYPEHAAPIRVTEPVIIKR